MAIVCKICNKEYSSFSSRSNHIKKFHNHIDNKSSLLSENNVTKSSLLLENNVTKSSLLLENNVTKSSLLMCQYCNKNFKSIQSITRHEKYYCKKNIINKIDNITDTNDKINILEKKINDQTKEISELKELLQSSSTQLEFLKKLKRVGKIHPKTLQKINKQLNNNTINNGIINNINIIPLGNENLSDILSETEKLKILKKRGNGLTEIVKLVHISNKYQQFKNIYITNLQNTIGYKYDKISNKFIAINKSELLDEIIDCRMFDIENFYNDMENKLDEETIKIIKRFIERMSGDNDTIKNIKKEEIKLLLYNSREQIINN